MIIKNKNDDDTNDDNNYSHQYWQRVIPVLAMSGSSADNAVTRSSTVGNRIDQQLLSSDWARRCTEDTTPLSLASVTTH